MNINKALPMMCFLKKKSEPKQGDKELAKEEMNTCFSLSVLIHSFTVLSGYLLMKPNIKYRRRIERDLNIIQVAAKKRHTNEK